MDLCWIKPLYFSLRMLQQGDRAGKRSADLSREHGRGWP